MAEAYKCDVCKGLFEEKNNVFVPTHELKIPTGETESQGLSLDMCPKCCKKAVPALIKLICSVGRGSSSVIAGQIKAALGKPSSR
jgi:hypothetical protein